MRKRLIVILFLVLFLTGCNCEYNLKIEDNNYNEEIVIISDNSREISELNGKLKIPFNYEEYNYPGDQEGNNSDETDIYKYKIMDNRLILTNKFDVSSYLNSTAVHNCYNQFSILNDNDKTIISTSIKNQCFDKYLNLDNIIINITCDKSVISSNADSVNNNTYTWNITKDNNKAINLILKNETSNNKSTNSSQKPNNDYDRQTNKTSDYTYYIVLGVILIILLLGYLIFSKYKKRSDNMDV